MAYREAAQTLDGLVVCLGTADTELLTCQLTELVRAYPTQLPRVRPEHWKLVSQSLVDTLRTRLGEARFNSECRESWETAVDVVSTRAIQLVKQQQN